MENWRMMKRREKNVTSRREETGEVETGGEWRLDQR